MGLTSQEIALLLKIFGNAPNKKVLEAMQTLKPEWILPSESAVSKILRGVDSDVRYSETTINWVRDGLRSFLHDYEEKLAEKITDTQMLLHHLSVDAAERAVLKSKVA